MNKSDGVTMNQPKVESVRSVSESYDARFEVERDRLEAICRSLIGDDAEDVVHDTYLIGRSRLGQLRNPSRLGPWLTRIAVTQCFQHHRRRQRLQRLLPRLVPAQAKTSDPDLRSLVEQLPNRDRTIVVLHYGHGLSLDEIAAVLALKAPTVRSLLFRTRTRLRQSLDHPTTS